MKKINVLNNFFNSKSDASNLEASEQEKLEVDFEIWFDNEMKDFEFASRFLMLHLGNTEKYNPNCAAIVSNTRASVMQGIEATAYIEDYIPD